MADSNIVALQMQINRYPSPQTIVNVDGVMGAQTQTGLQAALDTVGSGLGWVSSAGFQVAGYKALALSQNAIAANAQELAQALSDWANALGLPELGIAPNQIPVAPTQLKPAPMATTASRTSASVMSTQIAGIPFPLMIAGGIVAAAFAYKKWFKG